MAVERMFLPGVDYLDERRHEITVLSGKSFIIRKILRLKVDKRL